MSIAPVLPVPLLVPTMLALAGWAASLAVRKRPRARGVALACLRGLAALVLGACLLRPLIHEEGPVPAVRTPGTRRPCAFIIVERGARALPAGLRSRLGGLERAGVVGRFEFGGQGPADMREAVARAIVACGARPGAALLLLDDPGNATGCAALGSRLGRSGAGVFVVAPGAAAGPRVAVGPVEIAPAGPAEGRPAVASVELRGDTPPGADVRVRWTLDGLELAARTVAAPSRGKPVRAEHAFIVPTGGLHRLRVEVAPLAGEADVDDNASAAFFHARPGPVRALVVEGAPRPAYRSLRRALSSDGRFAVSASCSAERPPRGRLLPRDEADWSGLDIVVLGDLAATDLAPGGLERLSRFVREGGGLVIVAGARNLGPGEWGRTPLAEILPVKVARGDGNIRGPLDVRPAGRAGTPRPFPFGTGLLGGVGAALIDRAELRARAAQWRDLPELERARAVAGVSPGARVPVVAVRPGLEVPMLVHGRAGEGRVVVILSDDLPRWAASGAGGRVAHDEFWRDVAAGAARPAPDEECRVWLEPPARAANAGEALRLAAYFADASAPGSILMEYEGVAGDRGRQSLRLASHGLVRTFEIVPPAEGKLTLRACAGSGASEERSAPVALAVAPARLGGSGSAHDAPGAPAADGAALERLRAVCRASGGRLSTAEAPDPAVEGFMDLVTRTPREVGAPTVRRDVVPTPALLAMFAGLLIAEWALRRAWGME
ncbi:MAG: hypothetical protein ACYS9X_16925 [Planctomycetota bacterium]|jgi:hypothetical protein